MQIGRFRAVRNAAEKPDYVMSRTLNSDAVSERIAFKFLYDPHGIPG